MNPRVMALGVLPLLVSCIDPGHSGPELPELDLAFFVVATKNGSRPVEAVGPWVSDGSDRTLKLPPISLDQPEQDLFLLGWSHSELERVEPSVDLDQLERSLLRFEETPCPSQRLNEETLQLRAGIGGHVFRVTESKIERIEEASQFPQATLVVPRAPGRCQPVLEGPVPYGDREELLPRGTVIAGDSEHRFLDIVEIDETRVVAVTAGAILLLAKGEAWTDDPSRAEPLGMSELEDAELALVPNQRPYQAILVAATSSVSRVLLVEIIDPGLRITTLASIHTSMEELEISHHGQVLVASHESLEVLFAPEPRGPYELIDVGAATIALEASGDDRMPFFLASALVIRRANLAASPPDFETITESTIPITRIERDPSGGGLWVGTRLAELKRWDFEARAWTAGRVRVGSDSAGCVLSSECGWSAPSERIRELAISEDGTTAFRSGECLSVFVQGPALPCEAIRLETPARNPRLVLGIDSAELLMAGENGYLVSYRIEGTGP